MQGKTRASRVEMQPGKGQFLPDTLEGRLADLIENAKTNFR
jgi:hypothetical protein